MDPQNLFKIVVVLYSVSNLLSLGIELNLKETIRSLKSFRLIILTLAVYIAFPNPDPRLLVIILLGGPIPAISAYLVARYLGSKASKAEVTV